MTEPSKKDRAMPQGMFILGSIFSSAQWLVFICVLFVVLAWAYGLVLPPFENLDEIEHFSAIRYVADSASLPVHDPVLQEQYRYRQEASQPPLYYILMGAMTRLIGLDTADTNSYLLYNKFVACGPSDNPYNKHTVYHNPVQEAFPWSGALLALHILRALTPLLQLVTLISVYAIVRLTLPQHPGVALLATALTAFNPQFLLVASGVNNDNLVIPLATLGLYLALVTRQRGLSPRRSLGLGLLCGLAGLSKLSGLLLLGFVGLVLLETAWRSYRSQLITVIGHGLLVSAVTGAICGWWFWRNWQLYRDLTALEPMLDLVGRRASSTLPLNESGLMFRSFWGQLACAFFSDRFYAIFGLLTALGALGLLIDGVFSWRRDQIDRPSWHGMLLLAAWFAIVYVGWLRWGSITAATGGRLLFPATASTSTLLAFGFLRLWPVAWRDKVARLAAFLLVLFALATLLWELRPFFTPPRTYAKTDAPAISHPLQATFGAATSENSLQINLLGYDAEIKDGAPYLDVTFYWQAPQPINQDYGLAIQLTSPVLGDDSLRFNYNTWPGRGLYPTKAWSPGQIVADHYRFKLPTSDTPTQAWQLLVAFYETESGDRLPIRIGAQELGKGLILTTLRVPGPTPDCPTEAILAEPVHFTQQSPELAPGIISLRGALARPDSESTDPGFQVSLCWQSLAAVPTDYTVFVHLYDENGELLTTGDGPPMSGAFPTRLWQPGDHILDAHFVPLVDDSASTTSGYRIGVGLYDLETGDRLSAVKAGQPLPDNVIFVHLE